MKDNVYANLVLWIRKAGGHVHESLELRGDGPTRGVFCTTAISEGELLIRIPASLALSGAHLPDTYGRDEKRVSPWLKCLAALYKELFNATFYTPYIDTLPNEYESLLEWTDQEVAEYLGGTTLGRQVEADRRHKMLESRYTTAVRPYLQYLSLVTPQKQDDEDERFRQACMCISTRGFHLNSPSSFYSGPLLLPLIDLLNHNPARSCTTLKCEAEGFVMIAERDIAPDEQVFHSYGKDLSSAQVLQTFGFVPEESTRLLALGDNLRIIRNQVTPAVLSRTDLHDAYQKVIQSSYPESLRADMKKRHPDHASWQLEDSSSRDFSLVPDEFLISFDTPLPDELITYGCILLMPNHVYNELMKSPSLLDSGILTDYYLAKLFARIVITCVQDKLISSDDMDRLKDLYSKRDSLSVSERRALYGLTIRAEESACLKALRQDVTDIADFWDRNATQDDQDSRPAKKHKESSD